MAQGFRMGKKSHYHLLWQKKQNSTFDIFKFVVYSQFLQHSLFSAGEKLNQKDTNALGHSFLSKRKSSTQLISPVKHPLKGCLMKQEK